MLRQGCPHVFRGLCGGEAFEEEFEVGLGSISLAFAVSTREKGMALEFPPFGGVVEEPVLLA